MYKYKYQYMMDYDWKKVGIFLAGVIFGTAGIKILCSRDAKKVYTSVTAATLRAKECVMKTATSMQENAEDIMAEAKHRNELRASQEEPFSDKSRVEGEYHE